MPDFRVARRLRLDRAMLTAEPVPRVGLVVVALLPLFVFPPSSHACDLDGGLSRATELSEAGEPAAAASLLEDLVEACPDDFDLFLALGFHHFRAGAHRRAAAHYRRAVRLSHGNVLAQLGLGWAALRLGDRASAARAFEATLRESPTDASALEGLRLARRSPVRLSWGFDASLTFYSGATTRRSTASFGTAASLLVNESLVVSARYLGHAFELDDDGTSTQHQGHFELGWTSGELTLLAHYGVLAGEDLGVYGEAHTFGVRALYSGFGLLSLEASATGWSDQTIGRVAARWALPLGGGFYVAPELAAQWVDGTAIGTVGLGLGVELAPFSLWVGGRFGEERRSTNLALSSISNISERVNGGVYASFALALDDSVGVSFGYEWLSLTEGEGPTASDMDAHTGFLRIGGSF